MTKTRIIKIIIRSVLLLFVAGSIGYLLAKEYGQGGWKAPPAVPQPAIEAAAKLTPDHIKAYYFHGNYRCPTCRGIEKYSRSAINDGFPEELKNGLLSFEVINVEDPWNRHFIRDYGLYTKSLVIVSFAGDNRVNYKNLAKVWELTGSSEKFHEYVRNEVKAYLNEVKK